MPKASNVVAFVALTIAAVGECKCGFLSHLTSYLRAYACSIMSYTQKIINLV